MSYWFNVIFYQPILNLLVFFYNVIPGHDIGVAIIILTILTRLILYPFYRQSIHAQKALQSLQPKIEALKEKYKDNKEEQAKAMMLLYKEEKINPLSSCLPLLVQLPFLFAIYRAFASGLSSTSLDMLYPFIQNPGQLNPISLGLINLAKPSIVLAILAGAAQFWQTRMLVQTKPAVNTPGSKDEGMAAAMNKQMTYFMPLLTVFIGASLPAGLALYWLVTTVFMALQQMYNFRSIKKKDTAPQIEQGAKK